MKLILKSVDIQKSPYYKKPMKQYVKEELLLCLVLGGFVFAFAVLFLWIIFSVISAFGFIYKKYLLLQLLLDIQFYYFII